MLPKWWCRCVWSSNYCRSSYLVPVTSQLRMSLAGIRFVGKPAQQDGAKMAPHATQLPNSYPTAAVPGKAAPTQAVDAVIHREANTTLVSSAPRMDWMTDASSFAAASASAVAMSGKVASKNTREPPVSQKNPLAGDGPNGFNDDVEREIREGRREPVSGLPYGLWRPPPRSATMPHSVDSTASGMLRAARDAGGARAGGSSGESSVPAWRVRAAGRLAPERARQQPHRDEEGNGATRDRHVDSRRDGHSSGALRAAESAIGPTGVPSSSTPVDGGPTALSSTRVVYGPTAPSSSSGPSQSDVQLPPSSAAGWQKPSASAAATVAAGDVRGSSSSSSVPHGHHRHDSVGPVIAATAFPAALRPSALGEAARGSATAAETAIGDSAVARNKLHAAVLRARLSGDAAKAAALEQQIAAVRD